MFNQLKNQYTSIAIVIILILGLSVPALAISSTKTKSASVVNNSNSNSISQAVIQSYGAASSIQTGMIVQLTAKTSNQVIPLSQANIASMLGVVVPANVAPVALSPVNSTKQQVYVASTGRYNVLVSNQDGPVIAGEYITISSLNGIGMVADQNQSIILGQATSNFNGRSNIVGTVNVTTLSGKKEQVNIGLVSVQLAIKKNPLLNKSIDYVPSFLAKAAITIAAKPVDAARIYLGLFVLLVSTILTAVLLYSGIRSGMIAIGRNPLSRKSIIRSLIQTVAAGIIIFVIGIFAVYLLLKL